MYQVLLSLCILLIIPFNFSLGQSVLYDYGQRSWAQLEINKPLFDEPAVGFFSLTNYLNGQVAIGERWAVQADLPVYMIDRESDFIDDKFEIHTGNLGLGTTYRDTSGRFLAELMVRIPTATRDYIPPEYHTDLERIGTATLVDYSVRLLGNYIHRVEEGFIYRFRGGFNAAWPDDDAFNEDLDMEWVFQLAGMTGYAAPKADFQIGLATTTLISEEDLNFSNRMIMYFQAIVEYGDGPLRAFTLLRVPLEEEESFLTSLGIGCTYLFD